MCGKCSVISLSTEKAQIKRAALMTGFSRSFRPGSKAFAGENNLLVIYISQGIRWNQI